MMVRAILMTLLLLASLWGAREAAAQTCTASAPDVYFGNVPVPVPATNVVTQINISCSGTAGAELRVCVGIQWLGGGARRMQDGSNNAIAYDIYSEAGYTSVWDNSGPGQVVVSMTLGNTGTGDVTVPMYARMPGGTSPAAGFYNSVGGETVVGQIKSGNSKCGAGNNKGTFNPDTFNASVFVGGNCVISAEPLMDFGATMGTIANPIDAAMGLRATCNNQLPYTIALNGGLHENAGLRRMSDGSEFVDYRLYMDAGRNQPWGNGSPEPVYSGTGTGGEQALTVYGRVPGGQAVGSGTYLDTVTATITY